MKNVLSTEFPFGPRILTVKVFSFSRGSGGSPSLASRIAYKDESLFYGHPNCPVGRQPLQASDVRGIITFDRVVDSLEVYCSRRTDGCNWTGALETISGHQQQCLHEPVQCTHRGCSQTFPRGEMQRHTGECDMRPQVCGYCGVTLPFRQYHDHQELACRKAPVMLSLIHI